MIGNHFKNTIEKIDYFVSNNLLTHGDILEIDYCGHNKWLYLSRGFNETKLFPVPPLKDPKKALVTIVKDCELELRSFEKTGHFTPEQWKEHMQKQGYKS